MQNRKPTQFAFGLSLVGASSRLEDIHTSSWREVEGGRGPPPSPGRSQQGAAPGTVRSENPAGAGPSARAGVALPLLTPHTWHVCPMGLPHLCRGPCRSGRMGLGAEAQDAWAGELVAQDPSWGRRRTAPGGSPGGLSL